MAATSSGNRPAARSASVTTSRTARRFARTATQTCCSGAAGPAYSTSSGRWPRTFAIGRHALADLALQYRVRYGHAERLSDADFDRLYDAVEEAASRPVGREEARRRLTELRRAYEPKAQGLAEWLALELPPWLRAEDKDELMRLPGVRVGGYGRDLVG